jgi:hypothetical protein
MMYGATPDFQGPFYRQEFSELGDLQQFAVDIRACLAGAPYPSVGAGKMCAWVAHNGISRTTMEMMLTELMSGATSFSASLIVRVEAERSGEDLSEPDAPDIHPLVIWGGLGLLAYMMFRKTGNKAPAPAYYGPVQRVVAPVKEAVETVAEKVTAATHEVAPPDIILQTPSGRVVGEK